MQEKNSATGAQNNYEPPTNLPPGFHQDHRTGTASDHDRLSRPAKQIRLQRQKTRAILWPSATGVLNWRAAPFLRRHESLYGCYLSDAKLSGGRARMIRELDRLQAIGATNIRLLAGSETSAAGRRDFARHHAQSGRSGRRFARGPGFLPRGNGEAQHARNSFRVQLLAVVRRFRPIRPLGEQRDDFPTRTGRRLAGATGAGS